MKSSPRNSTPSSVTVLVAEDDPAVLGTMRRMLRREGIRVVTAVDGLRAVDELEMEVPDLILTDVNMPGLDGFELCERVKREVETRLIPVVMVTGSDASEDRLRGIEAGADDFISKPFDPVELLARVRSLVRVKRYTDELERSEAVLFALAKAIEGRDSNTEGHCERLSVFGRRLGDWLGLAEEQVVALDRAGIVHDIGKVAVPDAVLLKNGPLTAEERTVMERHPVEGERICMGLKSFERVLPIIRHHHEKLDGTGYPDGLTGDDVPMSARILQVVDVFDALTSERPYKKGMPPQRAFSILREEVDKGWWDRDVVDAFEGLVAEMASEGALPNGGTYGVWRGRSGSSLPEARA